MADARLIAAYRDELLARLPSHLAEEVLEGLADAQQKYLEQGPNTDQAARAAIAEFGSRAWSWTRSAGPALSGPSRVPSS